MTAPDDLAPLLGYGDVPDLGFRQGQIVAWDEATGTNTVNLGGVMLADLPALNLGEFTILQPGDIVALLRYKTSYFILGRLILPRNPDRNRSSVDFGAAGLTQTGFSLNVAGNIRASQTIPVPSWADEAIVHLNVDLSFFNSRAGDYYVYLAGSIDGSSGGEIFDMCAPNRWGSVSASAIRTMSRSDGFLGDTITVGAAIRCTPLAGGTTGLEGQPQHIANTNASVIFRRTD